MRCSLNLLVPLMILAAPAAGLAQSPKHNVGTPLSQEEIQGFDFMIGPEGQQLPSGAEPQGRRGDLCEAVRGMPRAEWGKGVLRRLVLGSPASLFAALSKKVKRTV